MAITINGNGTVTGISVGGLPDGIVDTDMLAAGAVTAPKRGAGSILQVVTGTTTNGTSSTSQSWTDTGLTATITPASSSNKILVHASGQIGHYRDLSGQGMGIRIVRTVSSSDTEVYGGNGDEFMFFDNTASLNTKVRGSWSTMISDSPSTTSACAYKVQVAVYASGNSGTVYFNHADSGTAYMHLLELAA